MMGKGGVSGAEGSVTLLVQGTATQLRAAKKLVGEIKGESGERIEADRKTCSQPDCWYRRG